MLFGENSFFFWMISRLPQSITEERNERQDLVQADPQEQLYSHRFTSTVTAFSGRFCPKRLTISEISTHMDQQSRRNSGGLPTVWV